MRKIIAVEYVSLDGVMENPSWTGPFWNDELAQVQHALLFASDALLLGRVTYEAFAPAWSGRTDERGFADRMNRLPKHVASTTLRDLTWNAQRLEGDLAEAVSKLKEASGQNLLVYGSGLLLHALLERGLVDELRLLVFPVVLGAGKRLFREGASRKLRLQESTTTSSGVALLTYQPTRPD